MGGAVPRRPSIWKMALDAVWDGGAVPGAGFAPVQVGLASAALAMPQQGPAALRHPIRSCSMSV